MMNRYPASLIPRPSISELFNVAHKAGRQLGDKITCYMYMYIPNFSMLDANLSKIFRELEVMS